MSIQEYINQKQEFYDIFHSFLENASDDIDEFDFLTNFILQGKCLQNKEEISNILRLLIQISNNHHRLPNFFSKIEQLLLFLGDSIKQNFTNSEIFNLFESNKRLFLFLITSGIVTLDETIVNLILGKKESNKVSYCHFFIPEIRSFDDKISFPDFYAEILDDDYEENRKTGENDSYLSSLIRNDLIEEFVSYSTQKNLSLKMTIKESLFETNSFLIGKKPTLIEYAAFFGSIQIFQYLRLNGIELSQSLWLYAIHSQNGELIHLLEENQVVPEDETYGKCFEESIKCHHNAIANYIKDNLMSIQISENFNETVFESIYKYYNYSYFPNEFSNYFDFYYLCCYNHSTLVNLLLQQKMNEIEFELIPKHFYFIKF